MGKPDLADVRFCAVVANEDVPEDQNKNLEGIISAMKILRRKPVLSYFYLYTRIHLV